MTPNLLVGAWKLEAFYFTSADGRITYPWGRDVAGYIIYTEQGRVSVNMMKVDRPRSASTDWNGATAEEKAAANDACLMYVGTYELVGGQVTHHIEVGLNPNWIGSDQVRYVELTGDRLALSTPPMLAYGAIQTGRIIWRRAPSP